MGIAHCDERVYGCQGRPFVGPLLRGVQTDTRSVARKGLLLVKPRHQFFELSRLVEHFLGAQRLAAGAHVGCGVVRKDNPLRRRRKGLHALEYTQSRTRLQEDIDDGDIAAVGSGTKPRQRIFLCAGASNDVDLSHLLQSRRERLDDDRAVFHEKGTQSGHASSLGRPVGCGRRRYGRRAVGQPPFERARLASRFGARPQRGGGGRDTPVGRNHKMPVFSQGRAREGLGPIGMATEHLVLS
jgi:hypothetical protein